MVIRVDDYAKHGIDITSSKTPNQKEQVAYDLHVGSSYRRPGDANPHKMPMALILGSNDCVRIDTEEEIRTPVAVFGQICSRASLTQEGLVVANLKIDPNFQGRLNITVFNTSRHVISIAKEASFCSLFFFTMENQINANSPVRVPPDAKILTRPRFREMLVRAIPYAITFGASVSASLLAAYIFLLVGHR